MKRSLLLPLLVALHACSTQPAPRPAPHAAPHASQGRATPVPITLAARADYARTSAALAGAIEAARADYRIPAISIALIDDQEVVWATGFGYAHEPADGDQEGVPAGASTVHRVGSVSKLFTDVAVMRFVERGELDLDAPLSHVLPGFAPENPFGTEITPRQLAAHRAGLVREPPRGHYFDDTGTTLAETVRSLNGTRLVHAPGTVTKYSNAGVATLGYALEELSGEPFEDVVAREVLAPLGIEDRASFRRTPQVAERLAAGSMWGYDRDDWKAPVFELGMSPAGNLYASVLDLARFASAVFNAGEGPNGRLLRPDSLAAMMRPERDRNGQPLPFGIGFRVDEFEGHKRCGHGGAVYGFATQLALLPEAELGVAVVSTVDCSNVVTSRLADAALRWMLAERAGEELVPLPSYEALTPGEVRALAGTWRAGDQRIRLYERDGELVLQRGPLRDTVKKSGGKFVVDGRLSTGTELAVLANRRLRIEGATYERFAAPRPGPPDPDLEGLIGEYGSDHNILFIYERDDGRLGALIEWFYDEPLERVAEDAYAFDEQRGLYAGETLEFVRGPKGAVSSVSLSGVVFSRRPVGTVAGETFRITPLHSAGELRRRALAARPPEEAEKRAPDLVEIVELDRRIHLDVRYATTNNFMGTVFYSSPRAFLQRPAAEALARVQARLVEEDLGLLVFDAYRPWHVTKMFWDATPDSMRHFVADPSKGSRHNRGCAVDLTLIEEASRAPLPSTSGYDEFTERAYPLYPGGTARERWTRDRLRAAMEAEGFAVYRHEWWHFDYQGWPEWPILDRAFDDL